jgi:ParB family chromosome partitioning protein
MSKILEPEKPIRDKIDIDKILELAASIKERGLLQPILVYKKGKFFEIEAGHRRFLACKHLGLTHIDTIIYEPVSEEDLHLDRAHENLIRENLNVIEEARLIKELVYEDGRGVETVAKMLSKSDTWIGNRMNVLDFPLEVISALEAGSINIAGAKEIAKVKDPEIRQNILESAITYGAPAKVIRQWIDDFGIKDYFEKKKMLAESGETIAIEITQSFMECRVCGIKHAINVLRHIWLCPDCMLGIRHLSQEVRIELEKKETKEAE